LKFGSPDPLGPPSPGVRGRRGGESDMSCVGEVAVEAGRRMILTQGAGFAMTRDVDHGGVCM
jgi:hypothetical protein